MSTIADNYMVYNHREHLAAELEWERVETSFAAAKKALVAEMEKQESDPELIGLLRSLKAYEVPDLFYHS